MGALIDDESVVRGSGHLVPLNRPHSSYALIDAFTSGIPLPELNPTGQGGGQEGILRPD